MSGLNNYFQMASGGMFGSDEAVAVVGIVVFAAIADDEEDRADNSAARGGDSPQGEELAQAEEAGNQQNNAPDQEKAFSRRAPSKEREIPSSMAWASFFLLSAARRAAIMARSTAPMRA